MLWSAVAFAAGIWIGRYAWRPSTWWIVASCFFVLAAAYFLKRRPNFSSALLLAAFFFAGALAVQTNSGGKYDSLPSSGRDPVEITAHVISEGNLQAEGASSFREQIDVESESMRTDGFVQPTRARMRINIYSSPASAASEEAPLSAAMFADSDKTTLFHYGQRISFTAVIERPRNFQNPGAFDYAGYMREQGIVATASVKMAEIDTLPGFSGNRISFYLARVRASILEKIHILWPARVASLLDAMLLGERSFVERSTRADFQRSGTYHMLVVAGLHVGILAMFLLWVFRRIGLHDLPAGIFAIALILIYAALTQEGSPVWRAALMISAYLIARFLYRRRAVLNAMGAAALVLLVAHPSALFGASFQMSFLCVGLIAGVAVPLLEHSIEPFARGLRNLDALSWDRSLPPRVAQFRLDLRMILDRAGLRKKSRRQAVIAGLKAAFRFAELAVVSAVMQLGMALPMAYYFHRATAVSSFANVLSVPLMQLLMPAAALAVAVSYVSVTLARVPAAIAAFALKAIAETVRWLGGMRIADVRIPTPDAFVAVLSLSAVVAAVFVLRGRRRWIPTAAALLALSASFVWRLHPAPQLRPGVLELTAIDVGQGDALLVVFPDSRTLLIDSGGLPFWTHAQMDIGEEVVSSYLWTRGISHLDAVALTHAHADHMGGLPAVIANFHPADFWLPEGIPQPEIAGLLDEAKRFHVKVVYRRAGDDFAYGGAQIRVLAPDPDFPIRVAHRNDESLVMKISYRQTSALLEADAEKGTERMVALEHPEADVLKVAHHGSATSSEPEFLSAVHPHFAVISVGRRNVYHHPRMEVLQRLQNSGVVTYRTDLDGATSFFLDGRTVTTQTNNLH